MTEKNFPAVMTEVFKHEGGYVNDRRDAGGETKFGISKRAHSDINIKELTKAKARTIYRRDYWDKIKGGQFPDGLDLVLMDASVNSGAARGSKWLQGALGVKKDGAIGPQTIAAAKDRSPDGVKIIQVACAARMGFLRGLRVWPTYRGGWSNRVASVEAVGVRMFLEFHKAAPVRETLVGLWQEAKTASKAQKKAAVATGGGSGVVGVGGGAEIDGVAALDPVALAAVVIALGLSALVIYGRSRNNKIRSEAFEAEALNVGV